MDAAQSLQFTVTCKAPGVGGQEIYTYTWSTKNIGAPSMMIRIEGRFFQTQAFFNKTYIINGAQQEAWLFEHSEWTDLSDEFSQQWSTWDATWQGYWANLQLWDGLGDIVYTMQNGNTVHIYNISVNPNLPNSLFQH